MTETARFFLGLLADHVQGRPSGLPEAPLDWEWILDTAQQQGLLGVIWYQCRQVLPQDSPVLARLHTGFVSDVFCHVCREQDFRQISAAFTEAGIPFLPMKGMVFRDAYPVPALRTMGDIDLVIHPADRRAANAVMERLGFWRKVDNHAVWTYYRDVVIYEIHDHMMYEPLTNQIDYRGYFDHVWDHAAPTEGSACFRVEENFHFLYLVTHTAKHVVNKGSGFRPFLDMALLLRSAGDRMDWDWIRGQLADLALLEFAETCFALVRRWFGVEPPFPCGTLDDGFYETVTQKAFQDGLFGLENEENKTGASAKAIRRSRLPYGLTALKLTLEKLFPPYRDMQLIPWYSFVDGRPWLLPAAWIYRFFYCARHKLRHSRDLLAQPYTCRRAIEDRQTQISGWGL